MIQCIKTTVLAAMLMGAVVVSQAQKIINEGTITYAMEYKLSAEQQALAAQLPAESTCMFSGNITKIEMEQQGATITFLTDGVLKTGLILVSIPMIQKQYAAKSTKEDSGQMMGKTPVCTDMAATGEKITIGNYNTEKYTYKVNGVAEELWATNDIQLPEGVKGEEFKAVKGTVVKFTRSQNGIRATMTIASVVEESVGPFSMEVPAGYETISLADLKAMSGQ